MSDLTADIEDPTSGELRDLAAVGLLRIMGWDDDTATREANGLLLAHEQTIRADERRLVWDQIKTLHHDAGPSQGYFDGVYSERDHCCAACGIHGEYGVEWPCPTLGLAERGGQ